MQKRGGFTLVEMLIVIVIIGILAAALIPRLTGMREAARDVELVRDVQVMQQALFLYYADHGEYPDYNGAISYTHDNVEYMNHRTGLMNSLSGYLQGKEVSPHRRPHGMSYYGNLADTGITDTNPEGDKSYYCPDREEGDGYTIIFSTRRKTFDDEYSFYFRPREGGAAGRYCVFPIE